MLKRSAVLLVLLAVCIPAMAKPKKKLYDNSANDLFSAALRTARERHVVTYVDEKTLMFTFQTGASIFSKGFIANAAIEPEASDRAALIINVQTKDGDIAFGAGDRMADKFFAQVAEELAGQVKQKSQVHSEQAAIAVTPPKFVPPEPSLTTSAGQQVATVIVSTTPANADISVDGSFTGNAPVSLKLAPGKHTITVSAKGYQAMTRDLTLTAGSEVRLTPTLEQSR